MLTINILKLIDALESNKFTQTTASLKSEVNGVMCHCALGVAIELYIQEHPGSYREVKTANERHWNHIDGVRSMAGYINEDVMSWYGFDSCTGRVESEDNSVSHMNDNGHDFRSIAKFLNKAFGKQLEMVPA